MEHTWKNENKSLRVGLCALGGLMFLLFGQSYLKSFSFLAHPQKFTAEFTDVAGLSRNATVNVQGVRVGTVESVEFTDKKKILVNIKITDETAKVPRGSKVTIQTLGLVGAKYIEIALPMDENGNVKDAPLIADGELLRPPFVEDPVRTELVMNRVAKRVDEIVKNIDSTAASNALNNFNQAATKLNKNMDRLKDAADSVQTASNNIATTSAKFGVTAQNASVAAERASTFFTTGNATLHDVQGLAKEFKGTSSRVNKLLDNPNFSGDLKETMQQARQTAEIVRGAIGDVSSTMQDKKLREEVLSILQKLQGSTDNIRASMEIVSKVANDQGLRSDLKDIVKNAKDALSQASNLLGDPAFKDDLKTTLSKVRSAATNVDTASKQLSQVLGKRAPLLQLLFGRPGKVKIETTIPAPTSAPVPGTKP